MSAFLRRKRLPPELQDPFAAFTKVLDEVEPAKASLTEVMPTTRMPGRPLPDALWEFEERLGIACDLMPGWRVPLTEEVWGACAAGLRDSLDRSRALRIDAPDLGGFEGLIWAVERLMDPLESFAAAAERFRALRVRS